MRRVVAGLSRSVDPGALGVRIRARPLVCREGRRQPNAAFGASPRLRWSAPQVATFSAFPWPCLRIVDARLDDAYGVNLLSAPTARFDLSLAEVIRGRLAPARAVLASPTVTLDLDRPPFAGGGRGTGGAGARRGGFRAVGEPEPFQWRAAHRQP